jgi:hypothetical protein
MAKKETGKKVSKENAPKKSIKEKKEAKKNKKK